MNTDRFLRHEGDMLPVFKDIERRNVLAIKLCERPIIEYHSIIKKASANKTYINFPDQRIVKPLKQLNTNTNTRVSKILKHI